MFSGNLLVSSIVSFIPGISYSSIIFCRTSSSSLFFVGTLLKRSSAYVPKVSSGLSPISKVAIPVSGNSYKKSSISCLGFCGDAARGPAIAPTEPNKSFPIFPLLSIFGKTKGLLESTSKLFWVGDLGTLLLKEMF